MSLLLLSALMSLQRGLKKAPMPPPLFLLLLLLLLLLLRTFSPISAIPSNSLDAEDVRFLKFPPIPSTPKISDSCESRVKHLLLSKCSLKPRKRTISNNTCWTALAHFNFK